MPEGTPPHDWIFAIAAFLGRIRFRLGRTRAAEDLPSMQAVAAGAPTDSVDRDRAVLGALREIGVVGTVSAVVAIALQGGSTLVLRTGLLMMAAVGYGLVVVCGVLASVIYRLDIGATPSRRSVRGRNGLVIVALALGAVVAAVVYALQTQLR